MPQPELTVAQTFLERCTNRQKSGDHGKPQYGGPCRLRVERCIQCVIAEAEQQIAHLTEERERLIGEIARLGGKNKNE